MGVSKTHGGMSFRDITCFNQALLAKQVWRLWKSSDNLVAKIIKAKYYPDCSTLDAPLGKKHSFAWSIQGTCSLVREGLIWKVGNGEKFHIWKDK
jgi:hypothetical protein